MNKFIDIEKLLLKIITDGVKVKFEDRESLGWNTYGTFNHAEIIDYINLADNDCWDAQIFGYKEPFNFNKTFKTKKLLGFIMMPNGNHKIILKLRNRGFSRKRFNKQLETYISNYKLKNSIEGKYIDLEKD